MSSGFRRRAPYVNYTFSSGFPEMLYREDVSLLVSAYQTGRLFAISSPDGVQLSVNYTNLSKVTGIDLRDGHLAAATEAEITYYREVRAHPREAVFVAHRSEVIGPVAPHQIGLKSDGSAVFAATMYNCIASSSSDAHLSPIWKPPFIEGIAYGDRCHLNGLAMVDERPRFATTFSSTNEPSGWREGAKGNGTLIDIENNQIIAENLTMPHSPFFDGENIWVANSGTGEIGRVDLGQHCLAPAVFVPGYVRGLKIRNGLGYAAASKFRHERMASELAQSLREQDVEPQCGIFIFDTETNSLAENFQFHGSVTEIFDIAFVEGARTVEFANPKQPNFHEKMLVKQGWGA